MQKSPRSLAYRYATYTLSRRQAGPRYWFYLWLALSSLNLAQFIWLGRSWSDAAMACLFLLLAYDEWLWRGVREVFDEQAQPAREGSPELSAGLEK